MCVKNMAVTMRLVAKQGVTFVKKMHTLELLLYDFVAMASSIIWFVMTARGAFQVQMKQIYGVQHYAVEE